MCACCACGAATARMVSARKTREYVFKKSRAGKRRKGHVAALTAVNWALGKTK